jgi:hypothetical protein
VLKTLTLLLALRLLQSCLLSFFQIKLHLSQQARGWMVVCSLETTGRPGGNNEAAQSLANFFFRFVSQAQELVSSLDLALGSNGWCRRWLSIEESEKVAGHGTCFWTPGLEEPGKSSPALFKKGTKVGSSENECHAACRAVCFGIRKRLLMS